MNPRLVRPLRIAFAGAVYYITARDDRQEDIYLVDLDRLRPEVAFSSSALTVRPVVGQYQRSI